MTDATTQAVLDIVQEVLAHNGAAAAAPVGPDDDLYDLGFDSLLTIQVAARVSERLGAQLPLATYFDAGTVAELATAVAEAAATATAAMEVAP